jgi:hypothetical protein
MGKTCRTHGGDENADNILVGNPEGKRPLGRSRHRQDDNINMYNKKIGCERANWVQLAQDRFQWWDFVLSTMKICVLLKVSNF